ncbi:MAG TPA: DNA alkylation repair protein [Pyrinomonadaceae bacterium]|nr:DNA alkylation repair protein [Pyrinomonadaceae bacterium]
MKVEEIIEKLKSLENPENIAGMARFGIVTRKALGVSAPVLKEIAKEAKKRAKDRHELALELWETGIHEARIVAYLVDDPKKVAEKQMDSWAADFDNWAICDGTCGHLFCKTEFAYKKVFEWSEREDEFIKRAGIVLIAWLAVHDKKALDEKIAEFLPILEKHAKDERNFIKKAVNWSLRQIGKRNLNLNKLAVETAEKIKAQNTKSARWIAADALRELTNEKTLERLRKKLTTDERR